MSETTKCTLCGEPVAADEAYTECTEHHCADYHETVEDCFKAVSRAAAEAALRWAWEHPAYGLKWEVGAGTEQDWEGLLAEFVARGAEGVGDAR